METQIIYSNADHYLSIKKYFTYLISELIKHLSQVPHLLILAQPAIRLPSPNTSLGRKEPDNRMIYLSQDSKLDSKEKHTYFLIQSPRV